MYLQRKILDYYKPVVKQTLSIVPRDVRRKALKKKYNDKSIKIIRRIKRYRNPWGQTKKNFNKFKKRIRRFKFQKRYKINSKMKFMKNNYFRSYENLFNNIMWIKKGFRKMYGNMTKHDSVIFHKKIENSLQRKNNMFENFFGEIECLLPVALYRLRLVPGIKTAKEYIRHGRIKVNSKLVTFINYKLQPHDIISLHHTLRKHYRKRFLKPMSNRQKKRFRLQIIKDRMRQRLLKKKNIRSKYKLKLKLGKHKKKMRQPIKIQSRRPHYYEFSKKLRRAVLLYKPKFYELHYNRYRFSFRMYLILLNNFKYIKY
jgi:ribosomal protein S4